MFGIKERERLLRESSLTLGKKQNIWHAAESMRAQMKIVDEGAVAAVNARAGTTTAKIHEIT